MPYETKWEERGVCTRYFGVLTGHEIIASITEEFGNPRFDNVRYIISDYLPAERYDGPAFISNEGGAHDKAAASWHPDVRVALVVIDPLLCKLCETYRGDMAESAWQVQIFDNLEVARS